MLAATFGSGCSGDPSSPPPLQATASSSVSCKTGESYQHTTLGYHLCFPNGWTPRDYTAEPGAGGAVSVGAFGPPAAVASPVPASGSFAPPLEAPDLAGPLDQSGSG